MNQLFGCQILPDDASQHDILFEGAQAILINGNYGQVKIFTEPNTHLQSYFSHQHKASAYVWGIPVHPEIASSEIPKWCLSITAKKQYEKFKELIGTFVVIIDEPRLHRITLVTDILGIRPMFLSKKNGRIVFGSDVWTIRRSGMTDGKIDYDAVSAWLAYGFNCTDGTLFSDLRRLPPGTAVVFQDNQDSEIPYVKFEPKSQSHSADQAAEEIHHIVSSTTKTLLAEHPQISFALSGGYDSRYLLALALSLQGVSIDCATVSFTQAEGHIASRVAKTLKFPLKYFPVGRSVWDLYDSVYHFMADGFPISKFVPYHIAQQYPQIPMANGFMGGSIIQGSQDKFLGKYETKWNGDLADVLQRKQLFNRISIFRKDIAEHIRMRSRLPMEEAVRKGAKYGKVFAWADFYYRQRYYIANNFLQHIQISEAVLPFYSWPLLRYKMDHDYRVFGRHLYHRIYRNHFPELADIPHASDLRMNRFLSFMGARCTRRRARQLLSIMFNKEWLSLLKKERAIPLCMFAASANIRRGEHEVMTYWRFFLLEKKLRDSGITFDWERI